MNSTGTRRHSVRTVRSSLTLVFLLLLLPLAPPAAASPTGQWRAPGPSTKLYIGQSARLTAQIPAMWTVDANSDSDYSGSDGFVRGAPLAASTLDTACAQVSDIASASKISWIRWRNHPACIVNVPAELKTARASMALVVAHPYPFTVFGTRIRYAALISDPAHFPTITATLSFAPDRVTPLAYALSIMDLVQARSLYRDGVDWPQFRQSAHANVVDWDSAHALVNDLITLLRGAGDNHSLYLSPEQNAVFSASRQTPPSGRRMAGGIAYVEVPGIWPDPAAIEHYVQSMHSIIGDIGRLPTCGWVVDLRENNGGDVYPMIQGLSPLLGNGRIFGFRHANGRQDWIALEGGAIYQNGVQVIPSITAGSEHPLNQTQTPPPIAVLIGPGTASSGELTAISFISRADTRLFGAHTGGYTTGNMAYHLFDGYTLLLAEVYDTDRSGQAYTDGVTPAEIVESGSPFDTSQDPVLDAAIAWLTRQTSCNAPMRPATPAA